MPDAGGPAPGPAEHAQADHHGNDEPQLLDDLARVLERVDEKPEHESRHHFQKRLA